MLQGQGIGSRLLDVVSGQADADRLPVVLLTYQPGNLALYRRHGYAAVCEGYGVGPWTGVVGDAARSP